MTYINHYFSHDPLLVIADISHYHHSWQWCTFFQTGATFSIKMLNFGPFWPFLSGSNVLFGAPFTGLNSGGAPKIDKYQVCCLCIETFEKGCYCNSNIISLHNAFAKTHNS